MSPLNMKQTPAERELEEEGAWRKAQKRARKASRLRPDDSEKTSKHKRRRSRSPSSRRKGKTPQSFGEYDAPHEDGWMPQASSHKVDLDALRAEMEERRFREKLFDAMGDDGGLADTEARFNDYDDYVPSRWRGDPVPDDPSMMDDEQYAEWVREGMWRRTHRAEVEAQERAEEESKRRREKERARREKTKKMEREESERRSRRRQNNENQSFVDAWIAYDTRWVQLRSGDSKSAGLTFNDLPWPCHPIPTLPLEPNSFSREAVSSFLLSPLHSIGKPRKQRLREALLLYHPDRFVTKWMGLVWEKDAPQVQEAVDRVARVLTGLVEEGDQGE